MPQLLTLSRAARLIGIRRGALQSKIKGISVKNFALSEGQVRIEF